MRAMLQLGFNFFAKEHNRNFNVAMNDFGIQSNIHEFSFIITAFVRSKTVIHI